MGQDLTDEEFVQRLINAGWTKEEAEAELKRIDEEVDEAGYDGP